jgi:uncharacterized membrane protein
MSIKSALIFIVVLFVIDQLWIQGFRNLHNDTIQRVQKSPPQIRVIPAALFYVLMVVAWSVFIEKKKFTLKESFLFGILLYATFDLTNLAIFKEYPVQYAMADILWGGFVVMMSVLITRRILS